jgi:hypothetical protein
MSVLPPPALDQLFLTARTYNEWSDLPVDEQTIRNLYDLFKWGRRRATVVRRDSFGCAAPKPNRS